METSKKQKDFIETEKNKYSLLTKIIFLIGMIVVLWTGILFLGILFWNYAYDWALISLDIWLLIDSIIISFLIIIELALYFKYTRIKEKTVVTKKTKPEFINGKKVHIFTYPKGMQGGIFSKTYVELDEQSILRLRALMVHPGELWKDNEEQKNTDV